MPACLPAAGRRVRLIRAATETTHVELTRQPRRIGKKNCAGHAPAVIPPAAAAAAAVARKLLARTVHYI